MPSRLAVVLVLLLLATPAVVFWLWLVIVPARVAILCPEGCWCDSAGYQIICLRASFNNIPVLLLRSITELYIADNNITSLKKDSFISTGLTELEKLSLERCELRTIEFGAFNGLSSLSYLSLSFNKISEIVPGTFEKMSRLEDLHLRFNKIRHLEIDVLSGLVNLKFIDLMGNEFQYLHPDLFVGLPNLELLDLDYNSHLKIPTDRHFINSPPLKRLYITKNNVRAVSAETFANLTALEWLGMGFNSLRSVDINILKALPKLSTLYLFYNPLQCDCQLQEVWRWCQDHNIQTAFGNIEPKCDTPSEVHGIWWGVLEKGQCLEGNISYLGDYKNTSYSYTPKEETDLYKNRLNFLREIQTPVYAFPFIFGILGNVIIIITIICNKDMRTIPNMYILNLAISDMIYLMVHFSEVCVNTTTSTTKWQNAMVICKVFPFFRRLSVGLAAYSVAVLSIQRYNVIVNPFHILVSSQPTWRGTVATIFGMWVVAALFAIPSAISGYLCRKCALVTCINYYQRVVLFELLVSCVFPLCLIAFSYIMTARHLVKSARPISEETRNSQLNTRKSTAKIVVGLTVVFLISSAPYHAFWTYIVFNEKSYLGNIIPNKDYYLQYIYLVSTCLLLINSCLNPVALFCTSGAFRRQCKRYLTCCGKVQSALSNFELTRRN
jgi:Leucine-rich repeat (LRR) protein